VLNLKTVVKLAFRPGPLRSAKDRAEYALLQKVGAYVRRRSKSSLKYKDRSAPPGVPPFVHKSSSFTKKRKARRSGRTTRQPASPLRELIYFATDMNSRSVVIGPKLGGSKSGAPRRLEEGGTGTVGVVRRRAAYYAKRPYMKPALDSVVPLARGWIKNMVR
jgi:hypothetical protein